MYRQKEILIIRKKRLRKDDAVTNEFINKMNEKHQCSAKKISNHNLKVFVTMFSIYLHFKPQAEALNLFQI